MMNFEDDAKINISNNNLDEVSQLCQELSNLENDIKSYEDTVKELMRTVSGPGHGMLPLVPQNFRRIVDSLVMFRIYNEKSEYLGNLQNLPSYLRRFNDLAKCLFHLGKNLSPAHLPNHTFPLRHIRF